jgi:hypothetical protein
MKKTFSSISDASTRNIPYIIKQAWPTLRSSWNLLQEKVAYSSSRVDNKEIALYSRPLELIPTKCCPSVVGRNEALMSHGSPRHSRMSNVLEPMELLIPMDPCPVTDSNFICILVINCPRYYRYVTAVSYVW